MCPTEQKSATTTWWVLYPLKGLDITDERHDLESPMFGDATILSRKYIRQFVPLLKLNERGAPEHDHEASLIHSLEHATFDEEYHSLVAVRRTGPTDLRSLDRVPLHLTEFAQLAQKRASQLASLVELAILAESDDWCTCALVQQIHRGHRFVAMLALDYGAYAEAGSGLGQSRSIFAWDKTIAISRHDLQAKLQTEQIAPLSSVLLPQKSPFARSLTRAITAAATRLCDAIHNPGPADQLLGAVTAMEILITNQGDSFETTKRRIASLIGKNAFEFFEADRVLRERHLYVHRGVEPSYGELPVKATGLSLSCILQYSKLATGFPARAMLLDYLDFVHLGQKILENWTSKEQQCFEHLTKHKGVQQYFEYFRERDSK